MFCWLFWELCQSQRSSQPQRKDVEGSLLIVLYVRVCGREKDYLLLCVRGICFVSCCKISISVSKIVLYVKWGPENKHLCVYLVRDEEMLSSESHRRVFSFIWFLAEIINFFFILYWMIVISEAGPARKAAVSISSRVCNSLIGESTTMSNARN